jgi:hypothetical protein
MKRIIKHENLRKYTKKYKGNNPNLTKNNMQHKKQKKFIFSPFKLHITFTTTKNQTCNIRNKKTNTFFSFQTSHHFYKKKQKKRREGTHDPNDNSKLKNNKTKHQKQKTK